MSPSIAEQFERRRGFYAALAHGMVHVPAESTVAEIADAIASGRMTLADLPLGPNAPPGGFGPASPQDRYEDGRARALRALGKAPRATEDAAYELGKAKVERIFGKRRGR